MSQPVTIRLATIKDAAAVRAIYAPYIIETSITFETIVPEVEEFERRITTALERYPYLVAELDGNVVGFAYATAFRPRISYIRSVETSIYVKKDLKRGGIGGKLYRTLAKLLALQNVYNLNACIAHIDPPDECVPATSRLFHEKIGFKQVAKFTKCARKFDRWIDMIWMEWIPVEHPDNPDEFIPLPEVDPALVQKVLDEANAS